MLRAAEAWPPSPWQAGRTISVAIIVMRSRRLRTDLIWCVSPCGYRVLSGRDWLLDTPVATDRDPVGTVIRPAHAEHLPEVPGGAGMCLAEGTVATTAAAGLDPRHRTGSGPQPAENLHAARSEQAHEHRHAEGVVNALLGLAAREAEAHLEARVALEAAAGVEPLVAQRVLRVGAHARIAEGDPLALVHHPGDPSDPRLEGVGRIGLEAELGDPDRQPVRQLAAPAEQVELAGEPGELRDRHLAGPGGGAQAGARQVGMERDARRADAADLARAPARPRGPAAIGAVGTVEADHLAQEVERG